MDKEDVVHIYNEILLNHRRNEAMPTAIMDGPRDNQTKSEKDRYHMISLVRGI